MKKIILLFVIAFSFSTEVTLAQLVGKRFISGDMSAGFGNNNPDNSKATHGYNAGINVGLGKFKTETRASGWNLSTSLSGRREYITLDNTLKAKDGIRGFGVGAGHFWHFYKHFNEKFGIYGGPGAGLDYLFAKSTIYNQNKPFDTQYHAVSFSVSITAGAYYALSERWWVLGSLGFSQPILLKYTLENAKSLQDNDETITRSFNYGFVPAITFPNVALGLRYFFRD
jgi:hypothetical protein